MPCRPAGAMVSAHLGAEARRFDPCDAARRTQNPKCFCASLFWLTAGSQLFDGALRTH